MSCENIKNGFNHSEIVLSFSNFETLSFNERRKALRDQLIDVFKDESPGTGKKENSTRHVYCVANSEQLENKVYLERPAFLNKGFDFTVNNSTTQFFAPTENNSSRITNTPRHDSLFHPLNFLKDNSPEIFDSLSNAIEEIFLCNNIISIEENYSEILDHEFIYSPIPDLALSIDIKTILHNIAWLFMEQDITYWSFTGRYMYYKGLSERYNLPLHTPS